MTRRRKLLTTINRGTKKVTRKLARTGPVSKGDARTAILYAANQRLATSSRTNRQLASFNINEAVRICRFHKLVDAETFRIAGFPGAARLTEKKEAA